VCRAETQSWAKRLFCIFPCSNRVSPARRYSPVATARSLVGTSGSSIRFVQVLTLRSQSVPPRSSLKSWADWQLSFSYALKVPSLNVLLSVSNHWSGPGSSGHALQATSQSACVGRYFVSMCRSAPTSCRFYSAITRSVLISNLTLWSTDDSAGLSIWWSYAATHHLGP